MLSQPTVHQLRPAEYAASGKSRPPSGSTLTGVVPSGTWKCKDGEEDTADSTWLWCCIMHTAHMAGRSTVASRCRRWSMVYFVRRSIQHVPPAAARLYWWSAVHLLRTAATVAAAASRCRRRKLTIHSKLTVAS